MRDVLRAGRSSRAGPVILVAIISLLLLSSFSVPAQGKTEEEWKGRTVYQILTDRFASEQCMQKRCDDHNKYCGGTWAGTTKMLGYIQQMGFDAMWMSPFTQQGPDNMDSQAYHGYWPSDFYKTNPAFGSEEDLRHLIKTYQANDIYVMFDQVVNHVGYGDFNSYYPFNSTDDFHNCDGCDGVHCLITSEGPYGNMHSYEHCKLSGLPDLNHSDPNVVGRLVEWMKWTEAEFKPDGIRFDACHNSLEAAIKTINQNVSVFTVGEMLMGDPFRWATDYIARWVKDGAIGSAFNYPMVSTMRRTLRAPKSQIGGLDSMRTFVEERNYWLEALGDKVHVMGSITDSHDIPRWLAEGNDDMSRYRNALAYILFAEGIPYIYYGTEQGFTVDREPLWHSGYSREHPLWLFLRIGVAYRKEAKVWKYPKVEDLYVDDNVYVFSRGPFVIVMTNVGEAGPTTVTNNTVITIPRLPKRFHSSRLRNIYDKQDKMEVGKTGTAMFELDPKGRPQVFYFGNIREPASFEAHSKNLHKAKLQVLVTYLALLLPLVAAVLLLIKFVFGSHKAAGAEDEQPQKGDASGYSADHMALPLVPGVSGYSGRNTKRTWFSFEQFRKRGPHHSGALSQCSSLKSMDSKGSETHHVMDTVYSFTDSKPATAAASGTSGAAGTADMAAGTAAGEAGTSDIATSGADAPPHQHWLQTIRAFQMTDSEGSGTLSPANSIGSISSTPRAPHAVAAAGGLGGALASLGSGGPLFNGQSGLGSPQLSAQPTFEPMRERILHVALEYSIPHLGFNNQLMFGGLGMVVDTFIKQWPGQMAVIAPLYKACYAAAPGCSGTSSDQDGVVRPSFLAPYERPLLTLTVDAAGMPNPVEVFRMVHDNVTYYLVQAEVFRHRERGQIYSFQDEDEMLTWLAVFNQAVAAVVIKERLSYMQLHDYHGGLSLMYIPERLRPAVLYVAHNAHYDATFPIPTPARRNKIYEHLNLNAEQVAAYAEHNGRFDILRSVVMVLRNQQQGHGVVAVSPRYAKQIKQKLSVFWQLSAIGRPRSITGILNALDMGNSLASQPGLSAEQVTEIKRSAKLQLQERYGLSVGEDYRLMVFVGRITHQKGCDIIAEAASYFMPRHPKLQLVVVGPIGDATGAAAVCKLGKLAQQYGSSRMYCPVDHYVAGEEKSLILKATDFCLVPSRFEPCGLVDIEFGWNGGLAIGHNTGGLGKMPGVYFTAQASHLSHLAAKLGAAVDEAMAIPDSRRTAMIGEALARRFPSDVMIAKYRDVWQQVDACYCNSLRVRQRELHQLNTHAAFFAHKWAQVNKKGASSSPSTATHGSSQQQQHLQSHGSGGGVAGSSSAADGSSCPGTPNKSGQQQPQQLHRSLSGGAGSAFGRHRSRCSPLSGMTAIHGSASSLLELAHQAHDKHARSAVLVSEASSEGAQQQQRQSSESGSDEPSQQRYWPKAQKVSNMLLVILQYLGIGPGALLVSFLLLQEVVSLMPGSCSESMLAVQRTHWWSTGLEDLATRLIAFYALSSIISPAWFFLAAYLRPVVYIRMASIVVFVSYLLALLAIYAWDAVNLVLLVLAVTNLVASPIVSFGFLGDEEVEVSEVGRKMVALGDSFKYGLLCVAMLMAATATSPLPHLAFTGFMMLLAAAIATWFLHPKTLSPAYQHLYLTYSGQWQQLTHLSCFWLTLLATVSDSLGALLMGMLVLTVTEGLSAFAIVTAVGFGASVLAVLWNTTLLSSRAAELRLNTVVLLLASMPFYHSFKALVIILVPSLSVMVPVCGVLDVLMGARSSIMGLAGFMTLPSQEIVSIWQVTAITGLTAAIAILVGSGLAATTAGAAANPWVLFGVICALEAARAAVSLIGMPKLYPKENLSAP